MHGDDVAGNWSLVCWISESNANSDTNVLTRTAGHEFLYERQPGNRNLRSVHLTGNSGQLLGQFFLDFKVRHLTNSHYRGRG